ncbi:MAG: prepilin-type N-terminal cleavage/methylation domain-containing protein, partial [Patescibacteria group bacterium]|nr:prepilin-type N-terminal cleavage/methylation domain-containing protein [Patescibacteria group bacterium]
LGFTLVELLVTLSLFVILTAIVLFNSSKFNGSILLTNLAYDVAITIRQAQTFGVNVREASDSSFQHAYGVHFDMNKNTEFILFADRLNDNRQYDGDSTCASSPECVDKYGIKRGNKISGLCVVSSSSCANVSTLDIAFIRPNPDAIINNDPNATEARITISSADGASSRKVVVNSTGQISIER